ncbi:polysaccharide biosynthesis/export family protein [Syntrophus sp. (in: bacteria)]|uniref:polysaccharide biosynthesis/export family protein n=1 Tax=Syntrophus sp. (in: bacteria) TaxID=48412 RepID=UPI00345EAC08
MKRIGTPVILCLLCLLLAVTLGEAFAQSAQSSSYRIGAGDALEISVWKDQSLTREIVVPPDGVITFPLIQEVKVSDLTVAELRDIVTKKISSYVPDANVTVILLRTPSMTASVVGKVNKPGQFPITQETDVMQILAMAGDLNPFAAGGRILILRKENGKDIKIPFDYNEVKKGKSPAEYFPQARRCGRGPLIE